MDEDERFPLALFEGDILFVTLFVVVLVYEILDFFIDGIGVLDGFIDEISSLLANNFSKLEIAWTSIITITQNIFLGTSLHLKMCLSLPFPCSSLAKKIGFNLGLLIRNTRSL